MSKENGYIKLYRSILDWEWYQDIPTKVVFLHLLLSANYEDKKWKGITVSRGEIVTSYGKIAEKTGLSYQQARNAVGKLKSTGDITQQSTHSYSLIHIENFEMYQCERTDHGTDIQQTDSEKSNSQSTTTKEIKNKEDIEEVKNKKEKNIKKESFSIPPEIAESFSGYVEMRRRIKNPMTDRAKKMLLNRLEELAPNDYPSQIKLLDEATLKGWKSVYVVDEKQQNGGVRYGQAGNNSPKQWENSAAVVL